MRHPLAARVKKPVGIFGSGRFAIKPPSHLSNKENQGLLYRREGRLRDFDFRKGYGILWRRSEPIEAPGRSWTGCGTRPPSIAASKSLMLHASCHCGAVRLEISRKPRTLTECNCSICGRLAARWAYYSAKSVRVLCDPGALQAFVYKDGTYEYNHCKKCGCVTHYRRINTSNNDRLAVNSRMMVPEDVASIKVVRLDVRKASNRPS